MSDPLGLINGAGGGGAIRGRSGVGGPGGVGAAGEKEIKGPSFKDVMTRTLDEVNEAQRDADRAVEDLVTGKRDDVEGVILATEKADVAFRMLQAMRNRVMQAYEEVKQVRT